MQDEAWSNWRSLVKDDLQSAFDKEINENQHALSFFMLYSKGITPQVISSLVAPEQSNSLPPSVHHEKQHKLEMTPSTRKIICETKSCVLDKK